MLKITFHKNGKISIKERYGRPLVYLDNWALNDIALDNDYRKRFIRAMRKRRATLRLSIQNIDELNKQENQEQIQSIINMIGSVDSGFINIIADAVIEKEDEIIKNPLTKHKDPTRDTNLIMSRLASLGLRKLSINPTISDIISIAIIGPSREKDKAFAKYMKGKLDSARNKSEVIKESRKRFHKTKRNGKQYDAATRELNDMAYAFIIMNEKMRMSKSSEWYDINHVIVPLAYCDIVLTDKKWITFVEQTGFKFPDIAMVFDKPLLEEFFVQLETNPFTKKNINWRNKIKL